LPDEFSWLCQILRKKIRLDKIIAASLNGLCEKWSLQQSFIG
jgi:hypothetical protein